MYVCELFRGGDNLAPGILEKHGLPDGWAIEVIVDEDGLASVSASSGGKGDISLGNESILFPDGEAMRWVSRWRAILARMTDDSVAGLHYRADSGHGVYRLVNGDGNILWEADGPIAAVKQLRTTHNGIMTLREAKDHIDRARVDGRADVWPPHSDTHGDEE